MSHAGDAFGYLLFVEAQTQRRPEWDFELALPDHQLVRANRKDVDEALSQYRAIQRALVRRGLEVQEFYDVRRMSYVLRARSA